ncbi:Do family serine endopeptidase [Bosea sp. (in: a-proteobacteria)]|uniref:Do family serine endopeptidase n=1 Tax=Bosea sp. (in: a-proteobacteria) TaxID=1871050 RepID=UPI001219C360|nr:Do family serine endopeptidase [Bosea sp. (in: a-proteobacteria)]TAJ29334.1 MAG: Do family serine endopeptidase [Bosea sp. (in: a-proteobacteria)]
MSLSSNTPNRSPRTRWMASAAALTLLAGSSYGLVTFAGSHEARATQVITSDLNAQAMPSFSTVVQRVKPAVVSVKVKLDGGVNQAANPSEQFDNLPPQVQEFFRRLGPPQEQFPPNVSPPAMAQGSGFFVSSDGYVVTNNHVVQNAKDVTVTRDDGTALSAKVVGTDPKTDLALLKVNEKGDYPFVSLARNQPAIGDWVVAIGNPFGLGGTVTAGIVSAHGRDIGSGPYDNYLQIDAPINKGNSGGPTFNLKGEVVGVNTAIFSPSGGSVGLAFDIPALTVSSVVDQLEHGGKVDRGYLGVRVQPVTADIAQGLGMPAAAGALVDSAEPGTPAAMAGLQSGDVIVKVNGTAIRDARELTRLVGAMRSSGKAEITYLRDGKELTATIALAAQSDERQANADTGTSDARPILGVQLAPAKAVPGAGGAGVVVVGVDPNGQAAAKGLAEGSVILEVAGKPVETPQQVKTGLEQARKDGKKAVLLKIKTADGSRFMAVTFASA